MRASNNGTVNYFNIYFYIIHTVFIYSKTMLVLSTAQATNKKHTWNAFIENCFSTTRI